MLVAEATSCPPSGRRTSSEVTSVTKLFSRASSLAFSRLASELVFSSWRMLRKAWRRLRKVCASERGWRTGGCSQSSVKTPWSVSSCSTGGKQINSWSEKTLAADPRPATITLRRSLLVPLVPAGWTILPATTNSPPWNRLLTLVAVNDWFWTSKAPSPT